MKSNLEIIRNYDQEFSNLVALEVKNKATKEQKDFLFSKIDLWEIYLTALYADINTALSINDIEYRKFMEDESEINDSFQWKKRALYFKSKVMKRIGEVKLLITDRNVERSKNEKHKMTEDIHEILVILKTHLGNKN